MKNQVSATFLLTLLVVSALLGLYYLPTPTIGAKSLRRVDILSDLRPAQQPDEALCDSDTIVLPPPPKPLFVDTCRTGMTCIEDYADSTARGMTSFYEALARVQTLDRPVRIAYFGDSFIEADILTADLREMFQQKFGGCGVGYVSMASSLSGYRPTVRHTFGGWESHASTDTIGFRRALQDLSAHYFLPRSGAYTELGGQRKYASRLDTCEVTTCYFVPKGPVRLRSVVNGRTEEWHETEGGADLQTARVSGPIGRVRWTVEQADSAVFYGVAMDGRRGVCVDNFSLRGSSGLHLRNVPLSMLRAFDRLRTYDLIVLQYGLNVATERGVNYDAYKRGMLTIVDHLKEAFPHASLLLVSVGDRENRDDNGNLRTMPGVKNLIRYQQSIAAESHIAFWNLYDAMGGEGSIVEMTKQKMANLDYTHINFKGGNHVADILFQTLLYGKEQYERRKAYEAE